MVRRLQPCSCPVAVPERSGRPRNWREPTCSGGGTRLGHLCGEPRLTGCRAPGRLLNNCCTLPKRSGALEAARKVPTERLLRPGAVASGRAARLSPTSGCGRSHKWLRTPKPTWAGAWTWRVPPRRVVGAQWSRELAERVGGTRRSRGMAGRSGAKGLLPTRESPAQHLHFPHSALPAGLAEGPGPLPGIASLLVSGLEHPCHHGGPASFAGSPAGP